MQRHLLQITLLALVATTATAAAQGRGRGAKDYPPGFRPPPGMCRVWIRGRAPGQQPGVTDCVTARANETSDGRVIYGDRNDNPTYRRQSGIYTRNVYDADGNRVLQRVRRSANGTLSVLDSRVYTGIGNQIWPGNGNTNDCNGAYQTEDKHGKWKAKCRDNGENDRGDENRGNEGDGSHGRGKGHGKHN